MERWVALGGGRAGVERVVGGVGCIGRTMWRRRTSGRRRRCRVSSVSWSRRSGCMNRYDMGDEERERLRERMREREKEKERKKERERDTQRHTETHRDTQRHTETERHTERHTETHRDTEKERRVMQ